LLILPINGCDSRKPPSRMSAWCISMSTTCKRWPPGGGFAPHRIQPSRSTTMMLPARGYSSRRVGGRDRSSRGPSHAPAAAARPLRASRESRRGNAPCVRRFHRLRRAPRRWHAQPRDAHHRTAGMR
jgi:hypothetical protein